MSAIICCGMLMRNIRPTWYADVCTFAWWLCMKLATSRKLASAGLKAKYVSSVRRAQQLEELCHNRRDKYVMSLDSLTSNLNFEQVMFCSAQFSSSTEAGPLHSLNLLSTNSIASQDTSTLSPWRYLIEVQLMSESDLCLAYSQPLLRHQVSILKQQIDDVWCSVHSQKRIAQRLPVSHATTEDPKHPCPTLSVHITAALWVTCKCLKFLCICSSPGSLQIEAVRLLWHHIWLQRSSQSNAKTELFEERCIQSFSVNKPGLWSKSTMQITNQ